MKVEAVNREIGGRFYPLSLWREREREGFFLVSGLMLHGLLGNM